MSIVDIAATRGLTVSTIMTHIYTLIKDHPDMDISYLAPDPVLLDRIGTIIDTLDDVSAKNIYTALHGEISYDDIRWCRVFLKR